MTIKEDLVEAEFKEFQKIVRNMFEVWKVERYDPYDDPLRDGDSWSESLKDFLTEEYVLFKNGGER